jgi:hypothetical protein
LLIVWLFECLTAKSVLAQTIQWPHCRHFNKIFCFT